jgi:hypothetical protein
MSETAWLAVGCFALGGITGLIVGGYLTWWVLSRQWKRILRAEFAVKDAEIIRRHQELEARVKGGCRQRIEEADDE